MAQILSVVSGKGGVGKSTVCVCLADAMRARGRKTLLLELDFGLRGLDIMLGVEDRVVFDVGDLLSGTAELSAAAVDCGANLDLLAAASKPHTLSELSLRALMRAAGEYDVVLVDNPAGVADSVLTLCGMADATLVVTTPDPVCVRDAARLITLLGDARDGGRLLINRVDTHHRKNNPIQDFDSIIDSVGVPLVGVIPEDAALRALSAGNGFSAQSPLIKNVFDRVAARLSGETNALLVG